MKKTGKLPEGKIDTTFVLPMYSVIKIGDAKFLKLEYFFGYKLCDMKMNPYGYPYKSNVLVKILTGEKKGYLYKTPLYKKSSYQDNRYITFDGKDKEVRVDKKDDYVVLRSFDYASFYKNYQQITALLHKFPDKATWQELSDIVSAQNIELEKLLTDARVEAMDAHAKKQKLEQSNNKIFE